MYLIIGIVLLICGGTMILNPRLFYNLTEGWKNDRTGEPSDLYCFSTRLGGVIIAVVGLVSIIAYFLM